MRSSTASRPRATAAVITAALIAVVEIVGWALLALRFLSYPAVEPFDYWLEGALNSPFSLLGILLVLKRPENLVSWLFAGLCLGGGLQVAFGQYGTLSYRAGLGWPLELHAMWASTLAQTALVMFFIWIFLYYPTGALISRAWRPVAVLLAIGSFASVAYSAAAPVSMDLAPGIRNPFGLEGQSGLVSVLQVLSALVMVGLVGAIVGLVVRFRRSRGIERQQMKWFVFATVAGVLVLFGSGAAGVAEGQLGSVLWAVVPAAIGASAGIAVLRYRLYDIDLVINRTLVYAILTGLSAVAYLGLVFVLQRIVSPVTRDSDIAVAGSTLAVAALFRPLRARVQSFIDRRFYRRKYDASETLERFSSTLRDEVDLGSLSEELVTVVGSTMQPAHASIWLRHQSVAERGTAV